LFPYGHVKIVLHEWFTAVKADCTGGDHVGLNRPYTSNYRTILTMIGEHKKCIDTAMYAISV
jgi:hypothetical protein